ncbi:MAG: DUF4139 domain-containing protein [Opitutaceae bacterium]|jgi:hypothetical protein|nr:DUF4139 domain-containing protein [Opitutaceae bacterium]
MKPATTTRQTRLRSRHHPAATATAAAAAAAFFLPILLPAAAATPPDAHAAGTALTIYNQGFAVVRETLPLDLKKGVTDIAFPDATLLLEPDSVVLRDSASVGKIPFSVLEQSYRAETASTGLMLSFFEGKELDFIVRDHDAREYTVRGKVIRSGYTPGGGGDRDRDRDRQETPIIETDGKLRFSLPGEPLFPALADDALLRPTLGWKIGSPDAARVNAELGYVTGGFSWQASYNLIAPEKGDTLDIVAWVTIQNNSGKTFTDTAVKLLAGDVNKIQPERANARLARGMVMDMAMATAPQVTEKSFDEFHLYALARPVTLRNQETKQVELFRTTDVNAPAFYVYNGAAGIGLVDRSASAVTANYGRTQSTKKVNVYREFRNTKENNLGLPFPKGRVRFYRQDDADGRIEFTGENTIAHTASGETVKLYTGDAFDIIGERKQTDFTLTNRQDSAEEAFEIKIRNRKKEPIEVRITEALFRGVNWQIIAKSDEFEKKDARHIEFRVTVQPDEEKVVTYRVKYDWK